MSDAGIFSLSSLFVGLMGAVATGPLGGIALPEGSFEARIADRPTGYHADIMLADGTAAGYVQSSDPLPVALDKLPERFIGAVLAIEDRRFSEHSGLDPFALGRAALDTLGGEVRGGSTVSQQMIKNTAIGNAFTLDRKIGEAILSVRAHAAMPRHRILETYLESAWFGRGQTGAMRAPEVWFDKGWEEVTLGETAFLAAILKGPRAYDPTRNPARAVARRDLVIEAMRETGRIDDAAARAARDEELSVVPYQRAQDGQPWVESLASSQIAREGIAGQVGRISDRLQVTTTIEPDWQALATNALRIGLDGIAPLAPLGTLSERVLTDFSATERDALDAASQATLGRAMRSGAPSVSPVGRVVLLRQEGDGWTGAHLDAGGALDILRVEIAGERFRPSAGDILLERETGDGTVTAAGVPELQGAVFVMDPRDGRVLASVGGYDDRLTSFDRTRRARRQPGSAIKGFLYAAALDAGFRFDDMIDNHERTYFDANGLPWRPRNYDRSESGPIPLFTGFERSSNLAAASLVSTMGVEPLARTAEQAGVYEPGQMGRFLASSLGTSETTLDRLTAGYAALINQGVALPANGLERIRNPADGTQTELWDASRDRNQPTMPITGSRTSQAMTSMMRGVVTRGTAASAFNGHAVTVVGKTGTSQDHADAWFVGLTPHVAVGVWIGRDDNRTMGSGITGGRSAAVITADILQRAHNAGMISAEGYRDRQRNAQQQWPPTPFAPSSGSTVAQRGDQSSSGSTITSSSRAVRPSSALIGSGALY